MVRHQEITHSRLFEYPALARLLYLGERSISGSVFGISMVNVVVGIAAALLTILVLRSAGGDVSLWVAAPLLVLVGQNWDALTALTIALTIRAWLRGDDLQAGLWAGVGAAFKIVPAVLFVPMLAVGGWRRTTRAAVPAATVVAITNAVLLVRNPTSWWFPYKFAAGRDDFRGTIWAALPFRGGAVNLASALLLGACLLLIFMGVRRYDISFPIAAALSILAFVATNKLWQPHYVLWALPALAMIPIAHRPVRLLEWASLAFFFDLWRTDPLRYYGPGLWVFGTVRLVSLAVVILVVVRAARPTPQVA